MSRAAWRLHRGDAGLSLVELIVTMVVAAVTLPLVFAVVLHAQTQARDTQDTAASVDRTRLAVASLQREVRAGAAPVRFSDRLWSGRPERLAFGFWTETTTGSTTTGRCVQYRVVGADLLRRSWIPSTQPTPPAWPAAGAALPSGVSRLITGLTTSTTPSSSVTSWFEEATVTSVEKEAVRIVLEVQDGDGRPSTVTTVVATRNRRELPLVGTDPCTSF